MTGTQNASRLLCSTDIMISGKRLVKRQLMNKVSTTKSAFGGNTESNCLIYLLLSGVLLLEPGPRGTPGGEAEET